MGIIKDCPRNSIEKCTDKYGCQGACKAVEQFEKEWREEQEPENWMKECADFWDHYTYITEASQEKYEEEAQMWLKKLRTSSPQREWVGLTDEEIGELWGEPIEWMYSGHYNAIRDIEALLKEKNNG